MNTLSAWRYGVATGITAGLLYAGCGLVALVSPDLLPRILLAVVHGLDIRLQAAAVPRTPVGTMLLGLVYVVGWSFVAGAVFGAVRNALVRGRRR